ncbi:MAG: hypothetical protein BWY82_01328 [Verrucomicrobia bacterium ADurb.Bin474]|nr:MAG: hypothetical protein BWY82_01328 [Verrucomicrobia bacterium ADurb.Bin474]
MHPPQSTSTDREILGKCRHRATVHITDASNDSVSGHFLIGQAEPFAAVLHMHSELLKRIRIEKQLQPLPG